VALIKSKPIRTMLRWQLYATVALAVVAGIWAGKHGAVSAVLGGIVSVVASLAYGVIVSRIGVTTAGNVLRIAMRAEASKIILIVIQLWLVLTLYKSINAVVFLAAFTVTVLINSMALVIRDE
jgi:ATP synthase protein I